MRRNNIILLLLTIQGVLAGFSCRNNKQSSFFAQVRLEDTLRVIRVETETLRPAPFVLETVSNGKVRSANRAVIPFRAEGMITSMHVRNGQQVDKGQLLARLESDIYELDLRRANNELDRTRLEMENLLLGFGFRLSDSARVPPAQWHTAGVQSGYNQALNAYSEAIYKLSHTRIRAPFAGTVADLLARPGNHTSSFDAFCTLIDHRNMEVIFPVLESETGKIHTGQKLRIILYAGTEPTEGTITSINPRVDNYGLVTVTARVDRHTGNLLDGMNVKIVIETLLTDCLSVPKTAVVLRQGRQVVFVYENARAMWNYVETSHENSNRIVIASGLQPGMEVIVSGNLNLAHETPVVLKVPAGE